MELWKQICENAVTRGFSAKSFLPLHWMEKIKVLFR